MDTPVQLIVGLGNPGPQYDRTRHNAGADFVLALASHYGVSLKADNKYFGLTGKAVINGNLVWLLVPTTFMNRSGKAVAALAGFHRIRPQAILVAHDELDLNPGIARFKLGGGHGGHNGLKDTILALANNRDFARLRIGIGHPGHASEVVNFVLRRAPSSEQQLIDQSIENAIKTIEPAVNGQWNSAMKALHSITP
ncbi:aminoacyl-tRNA hydrolase [Porticoccus sp.]|uniref:aminoacyl-tRNA hydrolase n=1 Tax=Porticoccus sp. TaxID=2024853 RepID=UPI003F696A05